ncbi:hypothetical protein Tco_0111333 [Tanacetum coccineum]
MLILKESPSCSPDDCNAQTLPHTYLGSLKENLSHLSRRYTRLSNDISICTPRLLSIDRWQSVPQPPITKTKSAQIESIPRPKEIIHGKSNTSALEDPTLGLETACQGIPLNLPDSQV